MSQQTPEQPPDDPKKDKQAPKLELVDEAEQNRRDDAEMTGYIRRNIVMGVLSLVAFVGIVAVIGVLFQEELRLAANWVAENLGVPGLAALIFIGDALVSPIPPDIVLLVVAGSEDVLRPNWFPIISFFTLISVIGGNIGWVLGKYLGRRKWVNVIIGRYREKGERLMKRYGIWAVALGAATPLPFSVTAWIAGILNLRWFIFFLGSLFRIPRIMGYYLIYHFVSTDVTEAFRLLFD